MLLLVAQCVMCFRNANAQQLQRGQIFNDAILVLGIPALCILGAFAYWIYRQR